MLLAKTTVRVALPILFWNILILGMQSLFYVEKLENTLPHAFTYFLENRDANYEILRLVNFKIWNDILAVNVASLEPVYFFSPAAVKDFQKVCSLFKFTFAIT